MPNHRRKKLERKLKKKRGVRNPYALTNYILAGGRKRTKRHKQKR
jgi:hypothetical protein